MHTNGFLFQGLIFLGVTIFLMFSGKIISGTYNIRTQYRVVEADNEPLLFSLFLAMTASAAISGFANYLQIAPSLFFGEATVVTMPILIGLLTVPMHKLNSLFRNGPRQLNEYDLDEATLKKLNIK